MPASRSSSGWPVVGAAVVIVCFGTSAVFSLGVFLKPIEDSTGWTRASISGIASLNWIFNGIGSIVWGALAARYGSRLVAVVGGLILGFAFVLSSQATELTHLHLTFGVLGGFASAAFYVPLAASVSKWFTRHRGVAVALVSAGMGLGILVVAPGTRVLIDASDWRTAMLVLGDLAWLVIVPTAFFVHEAPPGAAPASDEAPDLSVAEVLRAPQFWLIAGAHLACCAAHSGPLLHMVTHAIDQGVPALSAATLLGVSGLSSIVGRVTLGALSDRIGPKRILVSALLVQAAIIVLFSAPHGLAGFYVLAVVFGIAYGGVMLLYALIIREYFGARSMSSVYGVVYGFSSLGMGLGSFGGGWLHDLFGTYLWAFLISGASGMAAVALVSLVRPLSRYRLRMAA